MRASGSPALSTWTSAASSSGSTSSVACSSKSSPYSAHVASGSFADAGATSPRSSVGLRTTWYAKFTAASEASARSKSSASGGGSRRPAPPFLFLARRRFTGAMVPPVGARATNLGAPAAVTAD